MIAATTQGPISAIVLMMEMTGYARGAIVPLLVMVATATLVARTIEPRSIYDARLSNAEVNQRQRTRDYGPVEDTDDMSQKLRPAPLSPTSQNR